jgi:diguanylate cyclase (GGDEF)-like protein
MFTEDQLNAMSKEELVQMVLAMQVDPLTGFLRREALEIVDQKSCVVAMVDINDLKVVNDTQGHVAGDEHILSVAKEIKSVVRADDKVIRYGGDEFVIVFKDVTIQEAKKIVSRINPHLAAWGVGQSTCLSRAMEIADEALYINKREFKHSLAY